MIILGEIYETDGSSLSGTEYWEEEDREWLSIACTESARLERGNRIRIGLVPGSSRFDFRVRPLWDLRGLSWHCLVKEPRGGGGFEKMALMGLWMPSSDLRDFNGVSWLWFDCKDRWDWGPGCFGLKGLELLVFTSWLMASILGWFSSRIAVVSRGWKGWRVLDMSRAIDGCQAGQY